MLRGLIPAAVIVLVSLLGVRASAAPLVVGSITPAPRFVAVPVTTNIAVTFDRAVDRASVTSRNFWAFGRWSGVASGSFSFINGDRTVVLIPDQPFGAGEQVSVYLSHNLKAANDAGKLRAGGYSFQFWTAAKPAPMVFTQVGSAMTTRTEPDQTSRAYGGLGADLNHDGYNDITVINEVSADLRVFLNKADGTGAFHPFLQPTFPIGEEASPSEVSDFNHDGHTDIATSNASAGSVSVLLGNGDGTFRPQQEIPNGGQPRGICVLDADGDGDTDIVDANSGRSQVGVMLNNGSGVFANPTFFDLAGSGHWALGCGDMNQDGLLDAVAGALGSGHIVVRFGHGDATFPAGTVRQSGGATWMLALGDLNGDQEEDVALVNNSQSEGGVFLGNGQGALGNGEFHDVGGSGVASDLGDLDGDGDLDWVTASFSGGIWHVFENNGSGSFTNKREFEANPEGSGSCTGIFDFDRDGDLDLTLIDETLDEVILQRNGPPPGPVPAFPQAWGFGATGLFGAMLGVVTFLRRRKSGDPRRL